MKKLILGILFIICSGLVIAQSTRLKLDSTVYGGWDNSVFLNEIKSKYTYDGNGRLLQELRLDWDKTKMDWVNNAKYNFKRDNRGNIITNTNYIWNNTSDSFSISYTLNYTYDTNNNILGIQNISPDPKTKEMKNGGKVEITYDSNTNKTKEYNYTWNDTIKKFINYSGYDYTYNDLNLLINKKHFKWDKALNDWFNDNQEIRYYDKNGDLIKMVRLVWNMLISGLDTSYIYNYSYDSSRSLEAYKVDWKNKTWYVATDEKYYYEKDLNRNITLKITKVLDQTKKVYKNAEKISSTFDLNNNMTAQLTQDWDDLKIEWVNAQRIENIVDNSFSRTQLILPSPQTINAFNNKVDETLTIVWDPKLSTWVNESKMNYYYSNEGNSGINKLNKNHFMLFPNPAQNHIYFNNCPKNLEAKIFNFTGKIVLTEFLTKENEIDISTLSSGFYMVNLYDGTTLIDIRKLIKN